jgi:prepilin-type N-terminal cleavage/methylation domain-containing protein/prepilin-type processing-associated H-X9-DG protein
MLRPFQSRNRRGFTLIELLVTITIIGLLVALMLPAVQMSRETARRACCMNNLKQLAIAAQEFHDSYEKFPTGVHLPIDVDGRPTGGKNLWVELLPYFEQGNLHNKWDCDDNRNNVAGGRNATQAQLIEILLCPSDLLPEPVRYHTGPQPPWHWGFYAMSSYGGNAGRRLPPDFPRTNLPGMFFMDSSVRVQDVYDGTCHTFLFGERYHYDPEFDRRQPVVWPETYPIGGWGRWGMVANTGAMGNVTLSTPVQINYQVPTDGNLLTLQKRQMAFGSGHPGGANFAFADGSVHFLRNQTSLEVLEALSTRCGGEVVSADDF